MCNEDAGNPLPPVVLITVHRRFYELRETLAAVRSLLPDSPITVVRADPTPGFDWLFTGLMWGREIERVIDRNPAPESGPISHSESLNIRIGLETLASLYPDRWCLVLAADVRPLAFGLKVVMEAIAIQAPAAVCHWPGVHPDWVYHTNWFAVPLFNPLVWPPISSPDDADVLERQWGVSLRDQGLKPLVTSNGGGKVFVHDHRSEGLPPFPQKPATLTHSFSGQMNACRPGWLGRFLFWCIGS